MIRDAKLWVKNKQKREIWAFEWKVTLILCLSELFFGFCLWGRAWSVPRDFPLGRERTVRGSLFIFQTASLLFSGSFSATFLLSFNLLILTSILVYSCCWPTQFVGDNDTNDTTFGSKHPHGQIPQQKPKKLRRPPKDSYENYLSESRTLSMCS